MLARTDALMSQAETGKIALRPSSPLWPVATRCVRDDNGAPPIWFCEESPVPQAWPRGTARFLDLSIRPLAQRVFSSGPRAADLRGACSGEPSSRHGSCAHVPSGIRWRALQGDEVDSSLVLPASEFFASDGAASIARAAIEPTKIACVIRMGGSPFSKRNNFVKSIVTIFGRADLRKGSCLMFCKCSRAGRPTPSQHPDSYRGEFRSL